MEKFRYSICLAACVFVLAFFLNACTKGYDADLYVGDYNFTTTGELNAYNVIETEGITHPAGLNETFRIKSDSGTAKIFRPTEEPINRLSVLVRYDSGEVVLIDALVNEANSIKLLSYSRNVQLFDGNGENVVYDGMLRFKGEGRIVDGVISIKIVPQTTFSVDGKEYGFYSSGIRVVAE
ncbi:MAG: hypothetical protein HUK15_07290 [Bacteroidales bacterium]|nr:hypothetical protein [Bacteroidales bacterium]